MNIYEYICDIVDMIDWFLSGLYKCCKHECCGIPLDIENN